MGLKLSNATTLLVPRQKLVRGWAIFFAVKIASASQTPIRFFSLDAALGGRDFDFFDGRRKRHSATVFFGNNHFLQGPIDV
jgi:hypothetical protein